MERNYRGGTDGGSVKAKRAYKLYDMVRPHPSVCWYTATIDRHSHANGIQDRAVLGSENRSVELVKVNNAEGKKSLEEVVCDKLRRGHFKQT